jgi:putative ABC transport system permease protein
VDACAILTLALGIGANSAIFSVINSVVLKPLAYPKADQLWSKTRSRRCSGRRKARSVTAFASAAAARTSSGRRSSVS